MAIPSTPHSVCHGGDIDAAGRLFGEPQGGWLDLSTGISPHPYPLPPLATEAWRKLPQPDAEATLIRAARKAYGASAEARIVISPGTQAAIQALPRLGRVGRDAVSVAVLGPTYGEHAHVWRAAGHDVDEVASLDKAAKAEVTVIVNPNNPDGHVIDGGTLRALHGSIAKRGGWLVIDEAFADVDPDVSIAAWAGRPGLVILRSFGKFFGLAGLRLGFVLTDDAIGDEFQASFGPWAVSGPALAIGGTALVDDIWCQTIRARLADDAHRLDALLAGAGVSVVGGTSLFRLVETDNAARLRDGLARRGILVRIFDDQPTLARIGLPGDKAAFERLADALASLIRA